MAATKKRPAKSKPRKVARKAGSPKSKSTSTSTRKRPPSKPRSSSAKSSTEPGKAVRLTFSYSGDEVKLISQQPVDMLVPPSDSLKGFSKQKGFWAELKTEKDKTLYRRVMHNPTRNDAEVFSDDPEQSISREPAPKRTGVFVVVVPDTEKGDNVTLSRSEPETKGPARGLRSMAGKPASPIMRFKLKK